MTIMVVFKIHTGEKHICVPTPVYPSDSIKFAIGDKSILGKIRALASSRGVESPDPVSG